MSTKEKPLVCVNLGGSKQTSGRASNKQRHIASCIRFFVLSGFYAQVSRAILQLTREVR